MPDETLHQSNGVDQDILVPCGFPDVGKGGTAVVIFAVCDNQKGSLCVSCAFDLIQTHLDRVEQRRQPVRGSRKDALLDSREIGGEDFDEPRERAPRPPRVQTEKAGA